MSRRQLSAWGNASPAGNQLNSDLIVGAQGRDQTGALGRLGFGAFALKQMEINAVRLCFGDAMITRA